MYKVMSEEDLKTYGADFLSGVDRGDYVELIKKDFTQIDGICLVQIMKNDK